MRSGPWVSAVSRSFSRDGRETGPVKKGDGAMAFELDDEEILGWGAVIVLSVILLIVTIALTTIWMRVDE